MRVGHLQVTKPEWYDRQPTVKTQGYFNLTKAPNGFYETLLSYAVPTDKLAYLDMAQMMMVTETAPAVAGYQDWALELNVGAGATYALRMINHVTNLQQSMSQQVSQAGVLDEGDTARLIYHDNAVGGAYSINGFIKVTEFTPIL